MDIVKSLDDQASGATSADFVLAGGDLWEGRVFGFFQGPSSAGTCALEVSPDGGTTWCGAGISVSNSAELVSGLVMATHYRWNPSGYTAGNFSVWTGTA